MTLSSWLAVSALGPGPAGQPSAELSHESFKFQVQPELTPDLEEYYSSLKPVTVSHRIIVIDVPPDHRTI